MPKNIRELAEAAEKLSKANKVLQQRLRDAEQFIAGIKEEKIDALVIGGKKALKVYTEKTADKTYRILIEKMHEGAVTLNEDGTILYCNSYFANMVNLPLQKVIGARLSKFIEGSKDHFEELLEQGWKHAIKEELYIYTNEGTPIPVLMSVNALTLDKNIALSIILSDLTIPNKNKEKLKHRTRQLEQKNAELESAIKELAFQIKEKEKRGAELSIANIDVKELEGLNMHKESILATLSHDLRSLLAGIIGLAENLKDNFDKLNRADVKEMLDRLYKASTDELGMLDNLVEWARIKHASEAFSPKKIELFQYVKVIFDTLNENAVANNIHFHNKIEKDIHVFADGKMLLSILQNIVSNAIKYSHKGGKITVIAKRNENKIIVGIKDNGIGISKEMQEKLFTPQMSSLSKARKRNKGAGIGLLLAKGFVEKNGGEIWVESAVGKGSSFYFTLPVNKPADKIDNADKFELKQNV